jgi:hypothetical protein
VAVFPPDNLTGDDLFVEGGTLLEKYVFHTERVTVGDVLAAEARMQLASRGVTIIPPDVVDAAAGNPPPLGAYGAAAAAARSHIDAAVLFIEIRRWLPDAPFQPRSIIVSLAATLVDPSDQHTLWAAELSSRPIATPGSVTPGAADVIAAAKAIEELLGPLTSLRPPGGAATRTALAGRAAIERVLHRSDEFVDGDDMIAVDVELVAGRYRRAAVGDVHTDQQFVDRDDPIAVAVADASGHHRFAHDDRPVGGQCR